MRELRLILEGEVALYAISNEISLDLPDLDAEDQGVLSGLMATAAEFCDVKVLCWHVTPRGYGALIRVAPPEAIEVSELIRRVSLWYGEGTTASLVNARDEDPKRFASLCRRHEKKMHSILEYARLFQPRFSRAMNRVWDRRGSVWRQRFRSYLLEDTAEVRTRFAGYIHTRPHGDPDMGVFSSLFQADAGDTLCQKRYGEITGARGWARIRECLGEEMLEMASRGMRPSCGTLDSQKVETARRRSRERQKNALFTDEVWMDFFEAYQLFVKNHGSHRFPKNRPNYDTLRYWVYLQRIYLKRGRLGSMRREHLESISFPTHVNGSRSQLSQKR